LLCSPQAAKSDWVPRELDTFLQNSPSDKILLVLTDGELAWDSTAEDCDWNRTSAFPRLTKKIFAEEPLWIDLRKAKTAEKLDTGNPEFKDAVARMSSAMRQIPLDTPIGQDVREHKKAMRLLWSGRAVLSVLLIVAVVLGLYARRQWVTAEAGRLAAQADLIRGEGPTMLSQSALLAIESMRLEPSVGNDSALRAALSLMPGAPVSTFRFNGGVAALAFCPDGRSVAAGINDKTVRIFEAEGGKEAARLEFQDWVNAIAQS